MSNLYLRMSRTRSSCFREFQLLKFQNEGEYSVWCTQKRICDYMHSLPEDTKWNSFICFTVLYNIFFISSAWSYFWTVNKLPVSEAFSVISNAVYILHSLALLNNDIYNYQHGKVRFKWRRLLGYIIDIVSMAHYITVFMPDKDEVVIYFTKMVCYCLRLHRPFVFLWELNAYNLTGSVIGALLKYLYIFTVVRILFANVFIWLGQIEDVKYTNPPPLLKEKHQRLFYRAFYVIHKLFIPIGPESPPNSDWSRILFVVVMMMGCLLITGITIASLALIIGLYMRPEEIFRSRFRLIMNEMSSTNVPTALSEKVETFYRMYWHKQKAVSVTYLLPIFPPTLPATIHTNIYFEAFQKSRILCDLSYQFLSEIAKHMVTVHYIPGDAIIKRNTFKSSIIYISHGDVELLSAEDDETPLLRFSRGTILNPCGGCVEVATTRAHVEICAATFCTAHVLRTNDLWRIATKYGKMNSQNYIIHTIFGGHLDRVKRHYAQRPHEPVAYKSNIRVMKANLIDLKEAQNENGKLILERSDFFLELASCYMMRNRTDLALTEDADAICLRPTFPCILQPTSSLLTTWNTIVALLTLAVNFLHPYHLFFVKTEAMKFSIFHHMVTLVYIVDIFVHLSTGTKAEEGVAITFMHISAQQIKSYWFALDLLSAIPFIDIFDAPGMNKLLKLPKMFRVLKHFEDICVYHSNLIRFLSYCLLILYACYLVAAVEQKYWCNRGFCDVVNLTHLPYRAESQLNDGPVENRFKFSLYWSISLITFTTHKTAKLSKLLWPYQLFVMVILELSTVLHIMIEAMYSANIMVTETMSDQYTTCIDVVKDFLVKNDVDPILRHRVINYLQLCWFTDKAYSITHGKTSILYDLPPHVSQEIMAMQRSKYILQIPFMKYLHNENLKNVSANARLFYTSPNEILMHTGDVTNEIYIIKQGTCEVLDPDTKEVICHIRSKGYFGDLECLLRLPAFYTVRAVTHVQVFSISRKSLLDAIATPKIKDAINFAKSQLEYRRLQRRRPQFLTYEMPLPPSNREMFPLPRKHEPDTAFLQPFYKLGAFSVLRYVFPRYTIRPDGTYLKRYEWFRAACALMSSNIFPLYAILVLQWPWLWYFAVFLDITSYYDILQRMLVGYFDENGILVYHPSATAVHYLRGAFLLDMFACLPLEVLDSVRKTIYFENNAYRHPSTCQILMYNRIAQLYRFPNALEFLNEYIDRQDAILLIKAIPLFTALLVLVTSLIVELSVSKWLPVRGGWRLQIIRDDHQHGSWIEFNADVVRYNITETPWNAALTSFYWVVYETTTTGFNVFQPSRLEIMDVLIGAMILGAITTTYFAVRIISIRSNVNQALAGFQENMKDMVRFMKRENLDEDLQREVVSYYEYTWEKVGGTNYSTVLKLCDQITLRTDTIIHIYGPTFYKCPILKRCELALLRSMGRSVHCMYFRKHMTIMELHDIVTHIYFVDYGIIAVQESGVDDEIITKLTHGSVFGNLESTKTVLSKNKFIALSNVSILMIDAEVFYRIIQDFSTVKVQMRKLRPNNEDYIASSLEPTMSSLMVSKEASLINIIRSGKSPKIFKYFHSNSKFGQIYLILVSILCVYLDIYNAGFQNNSALLIVSLYILDVAFLLKIFVNYYFPYISEEEALSRINTTVLRKRYIKTELKFDILACAPFELFCLTKKDPWRAFTIFRLKSVLRMVTVYYCLKRYHEKLSINLTITTITSVFIWFTLFVHTSSCIWYYLGVIQDDYKPGSSWRYDDNGTSLCDNQYICSLYFILTTFTQNGVGDILPRKQSEIMFTCILMILSTLIYMIYLGEFSNIMQYQSYRYFFFYTKYLELQEFLKNNRVSSNLVKITNIYVKHLWRESRGLQVPQFLENAPQCLRLNIMSAAYIHHLISHPIFHECEPAFLRHVVGCFQPYTYNENMFVVKEGEITNAMYFIHRGRIQEIDEDLDDQVFRVIEAGDHFGTANGLNRDTAYSFSYKTVLKSQVLTLPLDEWEHLLKHFPRSKDIVYKNMDPDKVAWYDMKKYKHNISDVTFTRFNESQFDFLEIPRPTSVARLPSAFTLDEPLKQNLDTQMSTESKVGFDKDKQIKATGTGLNPIDNPQRSLEHSTSLIEKGSNINNEPLTVDSNRVDKDKTNIEDEQKSELTSPKIQNTKVFPWPEIKKHYVQGIDVKKGTEKEEEKASELQNIPSAEFVLMRDDQSSSSKSLDNKPLLISQDKHLEEIELTTIEETDENQSEEKRHVNLAIEKPLSGSIESKGHISLTDSNERSVIKLKTKSLLSILKRSVITFKEEVESKILPKGVRSIILSDTEMSDLHNDIVPKEQQETSVNPKAEVKSDTATVSGSLSTLPSSSSTGLASSEYSDPIEPHQEAASGTDLAYESSLSLKNTKSITLKSLEGLHLFEKTQHKDNPSKTEQRQSDTTLAHRHRRAQELQEMQGQSSSNSLTSPSTSRMLEKPQIPKKRRKKRSFSELASQESFSASPYVTANEGPVVLSSESIESLDRVNEDN